VRFYNDPREFLRTWRDWISFVRFRQEPSIKIRHSDCTICPSRCSSSPSSFHQGITYQPSLYSKDSLITSGHLSHRRVLSWISHFVDPLPLPQIVLQDHSISPPRYRSSCIIAQDTGDCNHDMAGLAEPTSSLCNLPPELILNSLARIDYTPGCLDTIRSVCRDFDNLLRQFEHSLTVDIVHLQFPPGVLAKHPGLHNMSVGFKTLDELHVRMHTLFRLERNCHSIRRREGKEAAWMRSEWIHLQQTGLHLLYRLYDASKRSATRSN
jgi:hypothetical protein